MSGRKGNLKSEPWQQRLLQAFKNDLITGLLVVIPLATTIWLTYTLASWVIALLTSIPKQLSPFMGFNPLLVDVINFVIGLSVPLLGITFVGLMARNIGGQWLLRNGETFFLSIPLAGPIYKTLKQLLETVLRDSSEQFRRVVLLEYPRPGIWQIGLVTGVIGGEVEERLQRPVLSVFLPTTPNPTTGWYAIVPEADVINLNISVEDAFKLVVSGGIVAPDTLIPRAAKLDLRLDGSES
ncbi:MAG: DUF502 domain-containing protein [Oscillatoriales cyanobacterium SM2_2_1]|nr:DUF502 domain-containing protein [Oscillatoriales cyanobacterium SM2_2_1]